MDPQALLDVETRSAPLTESEVKGNLFTAYAAIYNAIARLGDNMTESVAYGAFGEVLDRQLAQGPSIPFMYGHGPQVEGGSGSGIPLGHTQAGTLRLSADNRGLHVELDLPEHHPEARVLREQVSRGEVRGMSWGFRIGDRSNYTVEMRGNGYHRELRGFERLLDVSAVWNPAYQDADHQVEIRSYDQPMPVDLSNRLRLHNMEREMRLSRLRSYKHELDQERSR